MSNHKEYSDSGTTFLKVSDNNMDFSFIESFNTLAVNLKYSANDVNRILFTSASPSQGKTTVSVNSAIALANHGNKVLLIDCDLRKPPVVNFFPSLSKLGLSDYIVGNLSYEKLIQKTETEGLDVITSGKVPPSPMRILMSKKVGELIEKVSALYDWIIFDTPPVNLVTDATILVKYNIAAILVADQKDGNMQGLGKAIDALKFAKANILGIVVNNAPAEFRYGYASKYKYKYNYYSKNKQ